MFFDKSEKVFSLSGNTSIANLGDVSSLWGDLFCYLFLAGLYKEGDGYGSFPVQNPLMSSKDFYLGGSGYHYILGSMISKGLHERMVNISRHPNTTDNERSILNRLDGIFLDRKYGYTDLSAKKLVAIATQRNLSESFTTIAKHVSVMFGQTDFIEEQEVAKAYVSLFGNIHISKHQKIMLGTPTLIYGTTSDCGDQVTALWAYLSAYLYDKLNTSSDPLVYLHDTISSLGFAYDPKPGVMIPITRLSTAAHITCMTGFPDKNDAGYLAQFFYQDFLYGYTGHVKVLRAGLFKYILDLMVKKMGESHPDLIRVSESEYRGYANVANRYGRETTRSSLFNYALEAVEANLASADSEDDQSFEEESEVESSDKTDEPETEDAEDPAKTDEVEADPSVDSAGFDPSKPPPPSLAEGDQEDENSIDLISFDKTGEGVNEDLYRAAIVALNDKLRNDSSIPVDAEIKASLNYWVNGFLYLAAISATKDQIASLGLQKYLKNISTKG